MKLEIDVGNTRLKWRVCDKCGVQIAVGSSFQGAAFLDELRQQFKALVSVSVACVAQEAVRAKLRERVLELWGLEARFAKTLKNHNGLQVVYKDPSRLGVDRWLAMLAAWEDARRALCVIDCGSAITIDRVDADGQQVGGYIVPGLAMQTKALLSATGQIRLDDKVSPCNESWGESTEEAVNYGVLRMVTSFINAIVDEVMETGKAPALYITGGDAPVLLPMLRSSELFCHRPDLVMDGLSIGLP